jgi:O-antigen ligase
MFCLGYFMHFVTVWPLEKITGVIAIIAIAAALLRGTVRFSREVKMLLTLFGFLCLTIPFSSYRGGSFQVVAVGFSKFVLMTIATMISVNTPARLRRLMAMQTIVMLAMCVVALGQPRTLNGANDDRLYGIVSLFADPNDFALNICMVLPFSVSLFLTCHRLIAKAFWIGAGCILTCTVISTYSRGGLLALTAAIFAVWLCFRLNNRVAISFLLLFALGAGIAIAHSGSSTFFDRIATISNPKGDPTGSAQERQRLLQRSLEVTLAHPIFGVGPGQFAEISGSWLQTHNTYTQFSAEAGIPSLILFVMLFGAAFKSLRSVRNQGQVMTARHLANGIFAGLIGYMVGAFFLSTAFWFSPYLLIAYASASAQMVEHVS